MQGGKLIIAGSWNSNALPSGELIDCYEKVEKTIGGRSQTQDFVRLFMIPGATGCPVFTGSQKDFDAFDALQNWVEKGVAPESIVFTQREQVARGQQPKAIRSRPVCVYPKVAKHKGSGDINDAANFTCGAPNK